MMDESLPMGQVTPEQIERAKAWARRHDAVAAVLSRGCAACCGEDAACSGCQDEATAILRALEALEEPTAAPAAHAVCGTCGRPWTLQDQAAGLAAQDVPTAEIAAQLGVGERRVQQLLAAAGAGRPRGRQKKT